MALRNVARNWNRTGMIILSMAVASAMTTLTLALSSGYAEGVDLPWRQMAGADLLVYPNHFVFSGSGGPARDWEWRQLDPGLPTDALFFHPGLARGYLSPADAPPAVFDLEALPAALYRMEGVASVVPGRLLRAYAVTVGADGRPSRTPVMLRGRDIVADPAYWQVPQVVSGRYFDPAQDGQGVAIVNGRAAGLESLLPGTSLTLEVPALRGLAPDGSPVLDYGGMKPFELSIVGRFELYLGERGVAGGEAPRGETRQPPRHWATFIDSPDVWVPAATFDRIYAEVAGAPFCYTRQLGVAVGSMFEAKIVAAKLSTALPDAQVMTVPQEVSVAGIFYKPRLVSWEPFRVAVQRTYWGRATLAADIKTELSVLTFVVAGLLVVANMYILVTQRRREIGILKALGATGRDIVVLVLVETLGYSFFGSLVGFGAVRLVTMLSLFASPTSLVEGALLTLKAGGAITALTVGVSLVFGVIPARDAAQTPCATLLGDS